MATKLNISDFNQPITVKIRTGVKQPDGSVKNNWDTTRFTTNYANIKAISSNQGYNEGISEKDTYFIIRYTYDQSRAIAITDKIFWQGKELKPVGDCLIGDYGNKRVFEQKVKYTSA